MKFLVETRNSGLDFGSKLDRINFFFEIIYAVTSPSDARPVDHAPYWIIPFV